MRDVYAVPPTPRVHNQIGKDSWVPSFLRTMRTEGSEPTGLPVLLVVFSTCQTRGTPEGTPYPTRLTRPVPKWKRQTLVSSWSQLSCELVDPDSSPNWVNRLDDESLCLFIAHTINGHCCSELVKLWVVSRVNLEGCRTLYPVTRRTGPRCLLQCLSVPPLL